MFYVTCNNISVIYVTEQMCRQTEEVVPMVGLPIDILQGSLMCLSYTDTGPPFLYGNSDTLAHLRRTYSRPKPPGVLTGGGGHDDTEADNEFQCK